MVNELLSMVNWFYYYIFMLYFWSFEISVNSLRKQK